MHILFKMTDNFIETGGNQNEKTDKILSITPPCDAIQHKVHLMNTILYKQGTCNWKEKGWV